MLYKDPEGMRNPQPKHAVKQPCLAGMLKWALSYLTTVGYMNLSHGIGWPDPGQFPLETRV